MFASSSRHALKSGSKTLPLGPRRSVGQAAPSAHPSLQDSLSKWQRQRPQGGSPSFISRRVLLPIQSSGPLQVSQVVRDREVVRYNMELGRLREYKKAQTVFEVAREMKDAGVKPNHITYEHLLDACGDIGAHAEAWAVYEDMLAVGIEPNRHFFHKMLHAQRYRPLEETYRVLDQMKAHNFDMTDITYQFVIFRLVRSEALELSLQWLAEMGTKGLTPTMKAMAALVDLACQLSNSRIAIDLALNFEQSSPRMLEAQTWYNCLIAAADTLYADGVTYAWEKVVRDFKQTPDEGCCLAVLRTAGRYGLTDLALDVISTLKGMHVDLQEHHFAPVIEAFCKAGNVQEAILALNLMRSAGGNPVTETANPIFQLISENVDKVDEAWALLEDLRKEGQRIDIVAYNALIQACVAIGDLQRTLGTYQAAGELGVKPDVETYNLLLSACVGAAHRELGDRLLAEMRAASLSPNARTYEGLVVLCLTQATYEDAFYYLEEMKTVKLIPTQAMYEAIIRKCVTTGDRRYQLAVDEMVETGYAMSGKLQKFIDSEVNSAEASSHRQA